ncbi:MAG: VWA domain-containing protein [Thermoanaerobaculia bacterium]
MKCLAVLAILAVLPLPLFAQEQPQFGEKVDVNVVLLDAIVTDPKGNQILGLDKDDFIVKENGVRQTVDSVDYFTNRQLLNAPEQNAPFKVERVKEGRYFVFFFDKPVGTELFSDLTLARNATRDFIDHQMQPGDQVAIVAHDFRLKVYSDFTKDPAQLKHALNEVTKFGNGLKGGEPAATPSILAKMSSSQMDGTGTVYQALELLGDSLRPIKARKNVVLFSAGILEPGEEVRQGLVLSESQYYRPMIQALNRSNVSVYPINLIRDQTMGTLPALHQTLERIASETNGEYFRYPVSFTTPLKRIEKMNNGYYLISYYAKHPRGASGFQHVDVSLASPGLRIKARDGYVYGD